MLERTESSRNLWWCREFQSGVFDERCEANRVVPDVSKERSTKNVKAFGLASIYRVIREERAIFWEVTVLVNERKEFYTNMCRIFNKNRDRGVRAYKY